MRQIIYWCDHCGKKEIDAMNDVRTVRIDYDMNADNSGRDARLSPYLCRKCANEFIDMVSVFLAGVA